MAMEIPTHTPPRSIEQLTPGQRPYRGGRLTYGADETREVIRLLNTAHIPACVVGVNTLRYYGAGRITEEWDICVPTHQFIEAESIFRGNDQYEPVTSPPPVPKSLRHRSPTFGLKGVSYYFLLMPSSQCFIDPRPEYCELSKKGIPYPRMPQFAQALLALQNGADLADFIDGMNLDEKWGEENIDFDDLQDKGIDFALNMNLELQQKGVSLMNKSINFRDRWNKCVAGKEGRIEPIKKGRYKSRWRRIRKDVDPRDRDRPF